MAQEFDYDFSRRLSQDTIDEDDKKSFDEDDDDDDYESDEKKSQRSGSSTEDLHDVDLDDDEDDDGDDDKKKRDDDDDDDDDDIRYKRSTRPKPPSRPPPPLPPPYREEEDPFLAKFEEGDPLNPHNFSSVKKGLLTFLLGCLAFVGSFGSAVITPAAPYLSVYLNISTNATVYTVSLYVLGFALGPCIWAPLSEIYGRRWSMLPALFILALLSLGTAKSKTAAGVFATRFFGGIFASAPISNVSAALADMYKPAQRGMPMAFYTVCVSGGAMLGPVVGAGFISDHKLGWRWTEYFEAIYASTMTVIAIFTLPELYAPVILKKKAQQLRKTTGDERYWHPHEGEKLTLTNALTKYFSRPLRMLFTEPIMACICVYASWVYGLSYLLIVAFQIIFTEGRHWGVVVSTLPYLAVLVGIFVALIINIVNNPFYVKAVKANGGIAAPEARLPPMIIGSVLLVGGLFWLGWTSGPSHHWAIPVVASSVVGAGLNIIFQQCINYLVDVYGPYAASATAANTILRSVCGFALPLAAMPLFDHLGVPKGCSLLGGIAALAFPVPFFLMKYGRRLREMSKFAPMHRK